MTDAALRIQRTPEGLAIYRPDGAVMRQFARSNARVRVIRGPIRSGTSSLCCQEIWRRACEQAPGPDGSRRTRWAVVRNTYPDLDRSTVKTWLGWFPEQDFGRLIRAKPMVQVLRRGDVVLEVMFLALDKPEDVSKLRSTEWTGIWFNELEYISKEIFDEAESRVGYYPAVKDGGATWAGVIADMNAPTEDNWLVMMTGEVPLPEDMPEDDRQQYRWPASWDYFVQPPGLLEVYGPDGKTIEGYEVNPLAENLRWLPQVNGRPLYLETIKGKTKRWIDSRIMNRITAPVIGSPVWPQFTLETHVAAVALRYNADYPLAVGLDFGRRPSAIFGQPIGRRWQILGELNAVDVSAAEFAPMVAKWIAQHAPDLGADLPRAVTNKRLRLWGDPKGQDKVQSVDVTAYDVFRDHGMRVLPAPCPTNDVTQRVDAVDTVLQRMENGGPAFMLSPECRMLKMAMAGGYHWGENDVQRIVPVKDKYSNPADALQYLIIGEGEGAAMGGFARRVSGEAGPVQTRRAMRSLRRA